MSVLFKLFAASFGWSPVLDGLNIVKGPNPPFLSSDIADWRHRHDHVPRGGVGLGEHIDGDLDFGGRKRGLQSSGAVFL